MTTTNKMTIRLAAPLQFDSIVDGDGLRAVLWTQGCRRHCPSCHNPHTHDPNLGTLVDVESIKAELSQAQMQQGITFSGGEPFLQPEPLLEIARFAHQELGWDVWSFSGFRFDELNRTPKEVQADQLVADQKFGPLPANFNPDDYPDRFNFLHPYDPDAEKLASARRELLHELDALVDGPFVLAKRNIDLLFRGSENQRLLRLKKGQIISIE